MPACRYTVYSTQASRATATTGFRTRAVRLHRAAASAEVQGSRHQPNQDSNPARREFRVLTAAHPRRSSTAAPISSSSTDARGRCSPIAAVLPSLPPTAHRPHTRAGEGLSHDLARMFFAPHTAMDARKSARISAWPRGLKPAATHGSHWQSGAGAGTEIRASQACARNGRRAGAGNR